MLESDLNISTNQKRIGIYSGSFNPVHLGHLKLAEYLTVNELVDEVWFVVSPCNPLKNHSDLLDEYIRLEMLVFAIQNEPKFKASDVEFTMPIPSYSIDTLYLLRLQHLDCQFSLIIGSDNALVFDQWKNYEQILKEFPILVYPRKGYDFGKVAEKYTQMQLLPTPYYDISSTQIRDFIKQKQDVSQWLHPVVNEFITYNNLYC
ncbi:MAG: nicotinate-nucleotide adenylyltransferase [Paludibacter sp.]|nr:nicotinate-nucleotide adenylyltransferase [Paludibacter sp.]